MAHSLAFASNEKYSQYESKGLGRLGIWGPGIQPHPVLHHLILFPLVRAFRAICEDWSLCKQTQIDGQLTFLKSYDILALYFMYFKNSFLRVTEFTHQLIKTCNSWKFCLKKKVSICSITLYIQTCFFYHFFHPKFPQHILNQLFKFLFWLTTCQILLSKWRNNTQHISSCQQQHLRLSH